MLFPATSTHRGMARALATLALALGLNDLALAGSGDIYTIAGTGTPAYSGDQGAAAAAALSSPSALAISADGTVYIADTANHVVRRVSPAGIISTLAGTGIAGASGDGGAATAAQLRLPAGLALAPDGRLYIADTDNNRIRRIEINGSITTVAGTGQAGATGDGGAATLAALKNPWGIAFDGAGNLYIADEGNNRIRRVAAATGAISTVAGNGQVGNTGDGGPATDARLTHASGVALDASGRLYIADKGNHRVRVVSVSGIISAFAGSTAGDSGDGGPATTAQLGNVVGIAVGAGGHVYVSDTATHRVRQITPAGTISTLAGSVRGYSGNGGPANQAELRAPSGLAVDSAGRLWIADEGNHVVRRVDSTCGNGTVDDAEECDASEFNGLPTSCCLSSCQLRAAFETCRAAVDECDVAETCGGSSGDCPVDGVEPDTDSDGFCDVIDACPDDHDPQQQDDDADGQGNACDACTNTAGAFAAGHRLIIGRLSTPPGDDSLSVRGRILPFPTLPEIDPTATGVRVALLDAAAHSIMDARVPGGAWNPVTRRGWSVRRSAIGLTATFVDSGRSAPPAGGIRKLRIVLRDGEGLTRVEVDGRQDNYALDSSQAPVRLVISLDPDDPATAQCGEFVFEGPATACTFAHYGTTLTCS